MYDLSCARRGHPEIKFTDIRVFTQVVRRSLHDDFSVLHDISVMGDLKGHPGVLFDEDDGRPLLLVDPPDDPEDLLDDEGRESQGRLVKKQQLRDGPSGRVP